MFADNDRISRRQLLRQMILSLLGAWLLFLAGEICGQGQNGILGMTLGFLLLAGWALALLGCAESYRHMEAYMGKGGKAVMTVVYLSFLIMTGSFVLRKVSRICAEYLTAGAEPELLGLLLLAVAGIGIGNDLQRRARLAEIFYPFVMTGFVLMLSLAAFHMRTESFEEPVRLSATGIAREGWRTLAAGAVLAVLPFLLGQVREEKTLKRPLLEGMGKLWILLMAAVVILLGTFGAGGILRMEAPVLQLMAGTRLPGEFLERFDIVWLALLLCSLLFALGSILFYGGHLVGMQGKKGRMFRIVMGLLIYAGSVAGGENGIAKYYLLLTEWFYLPFFLCLTLLLWAAARIEKSRMRAKGGKDER